MKAKNILSKKDVIVTVLCAIFLLINIGAIGHGGRVKAKEAVCLSKLQQWGAIWQIYTNDYNGSFSPMFWNSHQDGSMRSRRWNYTLWPYYPEMDQRKLTVCPMAAKTEIEGGVQPFMAGGQPGYFVYSYGINYFAGNPEQGPQWAVYNNQFNPDYWRTPNVAGASNIPLMLDSFNYGTHIVGYPVSWPPPPYQGALPTRIQEAFHYYCINRHLNGCTNVVFFDWSARKIPLKQLWSLKWNRSTVPIDAKDLPENDWPEWMSGFGY